jgi:hypothetical protein
VVISLKIGEISGKKFDVCSTNVAQMGFRKIKWLNLLTKNQGGGGVEDIPIDFSNLLLSYVFPEISVSNPTFSIFQ